MNKIILSGRSNENLARKIAKFKGNKLGEVSISNFFDGEINVEIKEPVRGKDIFIVQSGCRPVNDHIIEFLLLADAARRSQVGSITLVMPYFPYSRKEKMSKPGEPISAKAIAHFIESIGVKKVIACDLHSPVLQGFFNIPVVDISTVELFTDEFKKSKVQNLVVVSPDIGGTKRARNYAGILKTPVAIIEKHRNIDQNDKMKVLNIIGTVKGKNVLLVDDIISTGSTIAEAVKLLKADGAKKIYIAATHIIAPEKVKDTLSNLPIEKIFTSDSMPITDEAKFDKLKIISLAKCIDSEIQ